MSAQITNVGLADKAQKQSQNAVVNVNKFVLALIPGQNPNTAINLDEGLPASQYVVGEYAIPDDHRGYINPDMVVYSLVLGPTIGNFSFNWIGLVTAENKLFAVSHIPTQEKVSSAQGSIGNTLSRNFVLKFQNAQVVTGITIEAASWQLDFTGRFNYQTELMRTINNDFYGTQYFVGDAFKVIRQGAQWKLKAGYGYVGGIRINLTTDTAFAAGALPADIWIDVWLDKSISAVTPQYQIVPISDGSNLSNYTDIGGVSHYVAKISRITSTASYTDSRRSVAGGDGLAADLATSWANFLVEFGGKTEYVHLTADTQLEKNSRYLVDNGLTLTLPDCAASNIGDAIPFKKKAGDSFVLQVKNASTETLTYAKKTDTAISCDSDDDDFAIYVGLNNWEIK